jgi:multidrug transporter EmrE-like cation transporter
MSGYLFLLATIICESLAIVMMKKAHGITNLGYFIAAIVCYMLSFFLLTWALKSLPMGWTNAIWAGASTLLVAIIGWIAFGEKMSPIQIFFMLLIFIGLVGLNFTKQTSEM